MILLRVYPKFFNSITRFPEIHLTAMTTTDSSRLRLESGLEVRHGLGDGRLRGIRVMERVEHHKVVDDAAVANRGDLDTGAAELASKGLAAVAEDIAFARDDECRREEGELLLGRELRAGGDLGALGGVGRVLVPEPLHGIAAEEVALRKLLARAGVKVGVDERVEGRDALELDVLTLVRHEVEDDGHVAADRVARDDHARPVEALGLAVLHDPLGDGVRLLVLDRVLHVGGARVVGEHEGGAGADAEVAAEPVVRVRVAEHPPGAVRVEDHRQLARRARALGLEDARPHLPPLARVHRDPLLVHVGLEDGRVLHDVDGLAALLGRDLEQERRLGRCLAERLRGGLKRVLVWVGHGEGGDSMGVVFVRKRMGEARGSSEAAKMTGWANANRAP